MPCPTCKSSLLMVTHTVEGENGLHYCSMECASDGMDAGQQAICDGREDPEQSPCVLVPGHDGLHVDEAGERWAIRPEPAKAGHDVRPNKHAGQGWFIVCLRSEVQFCWPHYDRPGYCALCGDALPKVLFQPLSNVDGDSR